MSQFDDCSQYNNNFIIFLSSNNVFFSSENRLFSQRSCLELISIEKLSSETERTKEETEPHSIFQTHSYIAPPTDDMIWWCYRMLSYMHLHDTCYERCSLRFVLLDRAVNREKALENVILFLYFSFWLFEITARLFNTALLCNLRSM